MSLPESSSASPSVPRSGSPAFSPDEVVAALRVAGCVFAEDEAALLLEAAAGPGDLERLLARRVAGLPPVE